MDCEVLTETEGGGNDSMRHRMGCSYGGPALASVSDGLKEWSERRRKKRCSLADPVLTLKRLINAHPNTEFNSVL